MWTCIAPCCEHTSMALRYGKRSQGISQFYLHTPHTSANRMSHTCLCLPSGSWYSFTDPGGMEGWVGIGPPHHAHNNTTTIKYKTKTHKIHNLWTAGVWRIARGRVWVVKRSQAVIGIDVAVSWLLWFVDTGICHGRWWVWILCHWHCSLWTDHICLTTATLLISQLIKQTINKSINLSINWLSKV